MLKPQAKEQLKTHSKQGYQKSEKAVNTLKQTAKAIGTSHDTLHKAQTIADKNPELIKEIDAGKRTVNSAYNQILKEQQNEDRKNNKAHPIRIIAIFLILYSLPKLS